MPNWCYNNFSISAEREVLDRFLQQYCPEGQFRLGNVIPHPEIEDNAEAYDWRCIHWSTPKEAFESKIEEVGLRTCNIYFETAWNPPWKILDRIVNEYKDTANRMWLYYSIEAHDAQNTLVWEKGELIEDLTEVKTEVRNRHRVLLEQIKKDREKNNEQV